MAARNSAAMEEAPKLEIVRLFDAPRELVFEVWSTAAHMQGWLGPKHFACTSCEMDFRVGGAWRACIRSPEGKEYWCRGTYNQITPPSGIVYSFRWEEEDALDTQITVTFAAESGKTRMTFTQTPFRSAESRESHEGGWSECFERLSTYISKAAA